MNYLITFLEGIFSFLSPCLLPLLPVYLAFFAGNAGKKGVLLLRTSLFVVGFTFSFLVLGLVFSYVGQLLNQHRVLMNVICGVLMILFGMDILDLVHFVPLSGLQYRFNDRGMLSTLLFGIIYPIQLTPCIGAFLGSALAMAAASGTVGRGTLLLLAYAIGLGLPFLLSALLMDRLGHAFSTVKQHYNVVKAVSGGLLIIVGILTASGVLNRWMAVLSM